MDAAEYYKLGIGERCALFSELVRISSEIGIAYNFVPLVMMSKNYQSFAKCFLRGDYTTVKGVGGKALVLKGQRRLKHMFLLVLYWRRRSNPPELTYYNIGD
jgi:hypothetical protein